MKSKKQRKLTNNIGLKLLALVIAIVLWLVVANVEDPVTTKQFTAVPVKVVNAEVLDAINKVYEIVDGATADFTVKGKSSVLNSMTADDFEVTADFSHLSDVNAVPVDVTPKSYANQIEIYKNSNTVVVSLEDEASSNFPITVVTVGEVSDGYAIGERIATPNIMEVTGPASMIKKIDTVQALVDVNDAYSDVETDSEITFLNGDGDELDASRFNVKSNVVSVKVQVLKTKEVPVSVNTVGDLAGGYSIKSLTYEPQKITIAGTDEALSTINEVVIDGIDVSGLNKKKEYTISPQDYLPDGIYLANPDEQIMITIEVGRYISKNFTISKDDIDISGGNPKYNYKIPDDITVTITASGYSDKLNGITVADFKPMIDVRDYGVGSYLLNVSLEEPEEVKATVSGKVSLTVSKIKN